MLQQRCGCTCNYKKMAKPCKNNMTPERQVTPASDSPCLTSAEAESDKCNEEEHAVSIFIRKLDGDGSCVLKVGVFDSVAKLFAAIRDSMHLPIELYLILVFDDTAIHEGEQRSVADFGIVDGSELILIKEARFTVLTSEGSLARIRDATSGICLHVFDGHLDEIGAAAYSMDGAWVLTASRDHTVKIWNASSGRCAQTLVGHQQAVTSAVFSSSAALVLSASDDATAKIWDVSSGQCMQTLLVGGCGLASAVFSADEAYVLVADFESVSAKLWDVRSARCVRVFTGHVEVLVSAVLSPDNTLVLTASFDYTARVYRLESGECIHTLHHGQQLNSCAFSSDGAWIVSAGAAGQDQAKVKLWDVQTGQCILTFVGDYDESFSSVAFSEDCFLVITASEWESHNQFAKIWDVATGECIKAVVGDDDCGFQSAIFQPQRDFNSLKQMLREVGSHRLLSSSSSASQEFYRNVALMMSS